MRIARLVRAAAVAAALYGPVGGSGIALGATRNCTQAERDAANDQLLAIVGDASRRMDILARHLPHGVHASTHDSQGGPDHEDILVQEGYILLHDQDLRTGLWVSYRLTEEDVDGAVGKDRVNCFRTDPRFAPEATAIGTDYDEPIYDQGHLANDADMKDDLTEQVNTYVLSNMSPQHCRFNRGVWLSLEHLGRIWAKTFGTVFITSGAIFDYNPQDQRDKDDKAGRMGSRNQKGRVAIPSDYYKIFLRKEGVTWHSIAFLLENTAAPHGTSWQGVRPFVETRIVPIEDIEDHAEVRFHPDFTRSDLVQSLDGSDWDLSQGESNLESSCP